MNLKTFKDVKELKEGIEMAATPSQVAIPQALNTAVSARLMNRLGDEYGAHYFYRAASDWCKNMGYFKAASYFQSEATSELDHAKLIRDYMTDWNTMPQIPESQHSHTFNSLVDIVNKAYSLELNLFNSYMNDSREIFSMDLATFDFLKQLRDIQTQSVAEYSDLLNGLMLINITNKFEVLYFENQYFS